MSREQKTEPVDTKGSRSGRSESKSGDTAKATVDTHCIPTPRGDEVVGSIVTHKRKKIKNGDRLEVLWRQAMCAMCRIPLPRTYHVDHKIPRLVNGGDEVQNLQALCNDCHAAKTWDENDFYADIRRDKIRMGREKAAEKRLGEEKMNRPSVSTLYDDIDAVNRLFSSSDEPGSVPESVISAASVDEEEEPVGVAVYSLAEGNKDSKATRASLSSVAATWISPREGEPQSDEDIVTEPKERDAKWKNGSGWSPHTHREMFEIKCEDRKGYVKCRCGTVWRLSYGGLRHWISEKHRQWCAVTPGFEEDGKAAEVEAVKRGLKPLAELKRKRVSSASSLVSTEGVKRAKPEVMTTPMIDRSGSTKSVSKVTSSADTPSIIPTSQEHTILWLAMEIIAKTLPKKKEFDEHRIYLNHILLLRKSIGWTSSVMAGFEATLLSLNRLLEQEATETHSASPRSLSHHATPSEAKVMIPWETLSSPIETEEETGDTKPETEEGEITTPPPPAPTRREAPVSLTGVVARPKSDSGGNLNKTKTTVHSKTLTAFSFSSKENKRPLQGKSFT